jgi:hypothetical protein
MGPVRQFVEAFNENDVDGMQAACTETTWIIDDFPPHEWFGRHATTSWYHEMEQFATRYGMSEWSIAVGEPSHTTVSDGRAYLAVPADVRWLQEAKPAERACLMTMSLRDGANGWRISSLAWAWR